LQIGCRTSCGAAGFCPGWFVGTQGVLPYSEESVIRPVRNHLWLAVGTASEDSMVDGNLGSSIDFGQRSPLQAWVAIGLLVALFVAADLVVNQPRGLKLALRCVFLLLGLLLVVWRPDPGVVELRALLGKVPGLVERIPGIRFTCPAGMEYSLFLVVAYVLVDYVLRTYSPFPFLVGVWDELLFIVIVGILLVRTGLQKLSPQGTDCWCHSCSTLVFMSSCL
jgi:hypothetical protein